MPYDMIYECNVALPSRKRAEKLVPPEFIPCYDWFESHAGTSIARLPHRMGQKPPTPIPISRDAGIYIPGRSQVTFRSGKRYALSVHSNEHGPYADRSPLSLADGTWILDYAAHEGSDESQGYNAALMNCMADGIPLGVFTKKNGGYQVLGLAFIERYNSVSRMFTLHGPVNPSTEARGAFYLPGFDSLPKGEQTVLETADQGDDRIYAIAWQVRREQQGLFRSNLLAAYDGSCAITHTDVEQVLQAAHINPYRGKKSQIVQNGILLRADIHLLYDAHLISVDPDDMRIRVSDKLESSGYEALSGCRLREPTDPLLAPSRDLLALHFSLFRQENAILVA